MKITKVLLEDKDNKFDDFSLNKTGVDPVTGRISWDVEYTPIISLDNNLEELYEDFKDAVKKYPDDNKLKQMSDQFYNLKRNLRSHISKKYK